VQIALAFAIPGMVIAMLLAGGYELWRQRRGKRTGTPLTATYINEFTAMFYGSKRVELDNRDSMSLLREEDAQGAPPAFDIDLDGRTVLLPEPQPGPEFTRRDGEIG
jgi:hypothetical protein